MIFDRVKTNIGNGYDAFTGMFVVPRAGTYTFTSILYNSGSNSAVVKLMKNKEILVNGYSSGSENANTHTMNAVLRLQIGDHVYVQHRGSSSDVIIGSDHCSFSGFMISD